MLTRTETKTVAPMEKYAIFAGLGGGFGGAQFECVREFGSEDEANMFAYHQACEVFESYSGTGGILGPDEIMEEEGVDYETALLIEAEERESWVDYKAEPYDPEKHDDLG